MKKKSKDIIVYNVQPDAIKSIKEYETDTTTGKSKLMKKTLYKYDQDYKCVDVQVVQYGGV